MANGFELDGFAELEQVLAGLPGRFGDQVIDKILRKGAQPYLKKAKELSSNQDVTGDTTKSLGIIANRKTNSITVGPRRGGPFRGYVAHILEYGAAPHRIAAKAAGGLLSFAGTFASEVNHPGIAAQPFLRPAFDATKNEVVQRIKDQCTEILESEFKSVFGAKAKTSTTTVADIAVPEGGGGAGRSAPSLNTGRRGGIYYHTASGGKRYVKKKK